MYELTLFHQIVSPNGKTVHIFRIGQPNVANKESADFAATGVSPAAKSSSNDLHVTASPRSGSGRVVHIELPSAPAHMCYTCSPIAKHIHSQPLSTLLQVAATSILQAARLQPPCKCHRNSNAPNAGCTLRASLDQIALFQILKEMRCRVLHPPMFPLRAVLFQAAQENRLGLSGGSSFAWHQTPSSSFPTRFKVEV